MIAARYVKAENWAAASDVLVEGAVGLLKAGQGGSGGDLACFLVDVFGKAEWGPADEGCKGMFCYYDGRVRKGVGVKVEFGR